jgi:hypothetical protein
MERALRVVCGFGWIGLICLGGYVGMCGMMILSR